MHTARQALIVILYITTLSAATSAMAARQTDISTPPTITIIGKRLSHDQKMILAQQGPQPQEKRCQTQYDPANARHGIRPVLILTQFQRSSSQRDCNEHPPSIYRRR